MRDPYQDARQEHKDDKFIVKLKEQVEPKPYYEEHKTFRNFVEGASYFFNIASAMTASYFVYSTINVVFSNKIAAIIIAIIFLAGLEIFKRYASGKAYKQYFFREKIETGWIVAFISALLFSVSSSFFGAQNATKDFAPAYAKKTDTRIAEIDSTLLGLNTQIAILNKTKWHGTVTNHATIAKRPLTKQVTALLTEKIRIQHRMEVLNDAGESKANQGVNHIALIIGSISLLLEILFLASVRYLWFFAYYSLLEIYPELFEDADGDGHFELKQNVNIKPSVSAIGFRFPSPESKPVSKPNIKAKTTPPPEPKQPVTSGATEVSAVSSPESVSEPKPETEIITRTETVVTLDYDMELKQLFRPMQSYCNKLEKGIGVPETACKNLDNLFAQADEIIKKGNVSEWLEDKTEKLRKRYKNAT